jgi:hypothetical protein
LRPGEGFGTGGEQGNSYEELSMATADATCGVEQIGETAGDVWRLLTDRGSLSMAQIVKQLDAPRDLVMMALGWLAREDKIAIDNESRGRTVSLR